MTTQSLRPFNSWNQTAITSSYLTKALNELPNIKQNRKIFFLGVWLGPFIEGQNTLQTSPEAQSVVRTWLAGQNIDPDLRLNGPRSLRLTRPDSPHPSKVS